MSFTVRLENPDGRAVSVPPHREGSILMADLNCNPIDSCAADICITYNYSTIWRDLGFSLRNLHGRHATDTVPELERMVRELGIDKDEDYWAATRGNAGHACNVLLGWALLHPQATWYVS